MLIGAIALAFTAGVLSVLSPCVLPILPIVLGAAITDRKAGLVALAAGLSISFVAVGMFVATIGYSLGLIDGPAMKVEGTYQYQAVAMRKARAPFPGRRSRSAGRLLADPDAREVDLASIVGLCRKLSSIYEEITCIVSDRLERKTEIPP